MTRHPHCGTSGCQIAPKFRGGLSRPDCVERQPAVRSGIVSADKASNAQFADRRRLQALVLNYQGSVRDDIFRSCLASRGFCHMGGHLWRRSRSARVEGTHETIHLVRPGRCCLGPARAACSGLYSSPKKPTPGGIRAIPSFGCWTATYSSTTRDVALELFQRPQPVIHAGSGS